MPKFRELSAGEMLADPIVRALMAADGVAAADVEVLLRATAKTLWARTCRDRAARPQMPRAPVLTSAQRRPTSED